jgi:predicted lactoylglutathione lyase
MPQQDMPPQKRRNAMELNKIVRIGHVCLEVTDIGAATRFYAPLLHKLGFKTILDDKESAGWSNENFSLFLGKPEKQRVSKKRPSENEFVIADHLALLLDSRDSVDEVAAFMKERDIDALFPPEGHPEFAAGYYSVSYCDHDNNILEFYTT